ncbi:MAG: dTDP-4-dehydrorhamnose 3,5-epimerase family protein [Acidobacteria bacterium]|nr:dTDP-4-dehydrorhamnose 3,5-epimerase family protein [Acidobacteriota bacterium]
MKVVDVRSLALPEIKIIRYGRFPDERGYFAEHFRKSDFAGNAKLDFLKNVEFLQCNESRSNPGTIRGLHFQWNPYQGKMVRILQGRMVDLVLDIRKGSPNLGKIVGYDMPANHNADYGEWLWVPPGFAHGNFYPQLSHIEYFCSGEYSPRCESGISPLAADIDWSIFDPGLREEFDKLISGDPLISDKDRNGHTIASWMEHPDSEQFLYRK